MALPWDFQESNLVLMPPEGSEPGECVPLPTRRTPDGRITSCWKLTDAELEEIARTGVVWLSVWSGHTAPPVYLTAVKDEVVDRAA